MEEYTNRNRVLISMMNSLEGYRLRLEDHVETSQEERSCLERLMHTTIVTALEYDYRVEMYQQWFAKYICDKSSNGGQQLSLSFNK